ncbi:hypothetical protein SDRG_14472 [Saprolegnia diclina VS20]|uniref:Uncharacterized protein n=1 Tax=Saprolegnia diclina (strain VS20) TaxID=1156394 RepID=T0PQE8_SAPDV|nr:hypothetical protein SDRG_14472 [Saprolegnia diclina VS20]EQC27719.1 hypothetical protein SDRG_14472 [Saprolegnia diclina VS20]|eukprot:XP_008618824.1 hypothetical protein SDRG_14472 [Saprolegnia diclina VS20]
MLPRPHFRYKCQECSAAKPGGQRGSISHIFHIRFFTGKMRTITSLAASVLLASATADAALVGGWSNATVAEIQKLYQDASILPASYPSNGCPRVCATTFVSASKKVVAGIQYKLDVQGCAVKTEAATTSACACTEAATGYTISLFARPGNETLITRIVPTVSGATSDDPAGLVGGFSTPTAPTAEDVALYFNATRTEANYVGAAVARVCPTDILTVSKQVVAGQNLVYSVKGCALPKASPESSLTSCNATCAGKDSSSYQVKVFASLTGGFEVSGSLQAKADGTFVSATATNGSSAGSAIGGNTTTAAPTAKPSSAAPTSVALASLAIAAACLY